MGKKKRTLKEIKEQGKLLWEEVDRVMDEAEKSLPSRFELNENSLIWAWHNTKGFDVAIISLHRVKKENCFSDKDQKELDHIYSPEENQEKAGALAAYLIMKGYGVIGVNGNYLEKFGKQCLPNTTDEALFVVNRNHEENFFGEIIRLGKHFCQDAVMFRKRNDDEAFLYGTNFASEPGYGIRLVLGGFKGSDEDDESNKSRSGRGRTSFSVKENCNVMTLGVMARMAKGLLAQLEQ
jgi:hypothetical protein